ncbi:MAG: cell division protein FtsQ/DivIB [Rubrobacteraceae bacterium]
MNHSRRQPLCFISIAIAIIALAAVVLYIVSYLLVPIVGVQVEGDRMLQKKEVTQNIPDHTSLLTLDTWALKRNLKPNPWVKGIDVTRDWRSGIVTVKVEERHAVLSADLGKKRIILAQDGTELPGLGGANLKTLKLDRSRLEEIVKAGKVLQRNGIGLQSVDASGPGGVRASVRGHQVIFAGELGQNQVQALGDIMKKNPRAGVFDLRSPERVVVSPPNGVSNGSPSIPPNG